MYVYTYIRTYMYLQQPTSPVKEKTYYIAREILTTEQTFVKNLGLLHKDFRQAVLSANRAHERPVLAEDTLRQILGNVGSLLNLNSGMLEELETRMANWGSNPMIGDIILDRAPFLKLYTEYISKFSKALKTLEEAMKKSPLFADVVHEFESQPMCANLSVANYMLEVVQRIPRYKLLLMDYVKHLPDDSPDKTQSKRALDIISEVANHVNETIRQMDNFKKLMDIKKKLLGDTGDSLITPYRRLLKEGELLKSSRKELQPRMFFLFNDLLLYTSSIPPANNTYKVIKRIPLDGMKVEIIDDPELKHGFQIISTCKSFRLDASTSEDLNQWITAFKTATLENSERMQSRERIRTRSLSEFARKRGNTELGQFAPAWLPDSAVSMCQLCSVHFTWTRRRHHCRACGMIFCGECSGYYAPLKYLQGRPGRICQTCFDKLCPNDSTTSKSPMLKRPPKEKQNTLPSVLREVKARDQNAQISGYLSKSSRKQLRWKKRWFVIYNLVLYEFGRHEDMLAKRSITLPSYQIISPAPGSDDPLVFLLQHPGTGKLFLKADNKDQLEEWMDILRRAVQGETGDDIGPAPSPMSPKT